MALYDKASLVLIPSQYKEGKLYNIKPLKDSFEFERGTAATRVNSDGLIEYVGIGEENQKVRNNSFDTSADWILDSGWSINTETGKLVAVNGGNFTIQSGVFEDGKTYYVEYEITDYVSGSIRILAGANYNLSVHSSNGIKRQVFTTPSSGGNGTLYWRGGSTFNGSISYVKVIEFELDTPRLDYSGTEPSLLLEPQRTNEVTHSINFNTYLTNPVDAIMTPNYGIAPDGTTTSTRFQWLDSTAFSYRAYNISTEHTASVYVKGTLGETVMFGFGGNVTTGNVYTFTGDWQRITFNGSSATQFFLSNYGGSTATEFEAWGLQLEQGSYPTSYIPTNGQTETRLADECQGGGDASVFNDSEGVLYTEIDYFEGTQIISLTDGTVNEQIWIYLTGTELRLFVYNGGLSQVQSVTTSHNAGTDGFVKVAVKYKQSDFAMWVNGVEVGTDPSGTTPVGLNNIRFSRFDGAQTFSPKCSVRALHYFPEALTDTELQQLTSNT